MINYTGVREAYIEAQRQIAIIEEQATQIGKLAKSDAILRSMPSYILAELKKKLKDYNSHTGVWK